MREILQKLLKDYICDVEMVCELMLKKLDLKSKYELQSYRGLYPAGELLIDKKLTYVFHGRGCRAIYGEKFVDWNFGYGSRWCGIDPWLVARTLEHNKSQYTEYYDGNLINMECKQAIENGTMYQKYDLYYFIIPENETFEPAFPKDFDILIIKHFNEQWAIPRNKMIDKFLRKSKKIYNLIDKCPNLYYLIFLLKGQEVYSISYSDIGYPENAVKIMNEILYCMKKTGNRE